MNSNTSWSQFWQQGFPTSFAKELPNSYKGAIEEFWRETAKSLDDNSRVLDIASGNGAIAIIIADEARKQEKQVDVHAADLASISPQKTNKNPKLTQILSEITFHPNVEIEQLPFKKNSFELISSQFGFEYSNIEKSITSISSSLKKGGHFKAICHFSESETHLKCKEDLEAYKFAEYQLHITTLVKSTLKEIGSITSIAELELKLNQKSALNKLKILIESTNKLLEKFPQSSPAEFISKSINYFFANSLVSGMDQKNHFAITFAKELICAMQRTEDQLKATLTKGSVQKIESLFMRNKLKKISSRPFLENENLIGWLFDFKKCDSN
ncbi:class I SAM-dependent methyltransferase [Microbulbifer thermotolerans]|nr:class I SAM-dependent methyltransferase [Microbulbifer thermotolerans]SFC59622.1 ubiE/COQ5 methyltransferase family protein [Microbulbifer thermotolerans]